MKKMIKLAGLAKPFLKEADTDFDQAFNIKQLKNIKFILPPWESVDKDFDQGKYFKIEFDDKKLNPNGSIKLDHVLHYAAEKHPSVAAMTVDRTSDKDFDHTIVHISKGNYAGLTYILEALDDLYGKAGKAMGWD
jgi:hypothetical protein